ncbi:MAG: hypothetical protein LCH51_04430 [Bacteroidetes bacterium]|mgnify:CR=1 FL=1|nr:hypothetical protein [Bacteroidota bacterium]
MEDLLLQVKRIQEKLAALQRQQLQLQRDNDRLQAQLNIYQEKDQLLQQRSGELERQLELARATRPQMTEKDRQALEKRINQYLKDIDKCIALLNE